MESFDDLENYFVVEFMMEKTIDSEPRCTDVTAVDETEPAQDWVTLPEEN